ncbi:MAG TPA: S41 family peptidase [Candidatus Latescibacteria bacterium]|jgi:carboxyl-terminal processing protease|nr:S41 family peptidase [Candidatus Latescibacterota bacterium]HJP33954.1 S41 family peptidase [Candidatus Latescibacterota bacterium]
MIHRLGTRHRLFFLALLLATGPLGTTAARGMTMTEEIKSSLIPIVTYVRQYYMYEVSPDTLMRAGLRGIFHGLDPASDFTITDDPIDCAPEDDACRWNGHFSIFERVARTIDKKAFYAVGSDTLIRYGIHGMMSVLDPDTVFMEKLNLDNFRINTRGEYGGLGFRIQVVRPDSAIAVWSLLHDATPAALAGVRSGDLILAIDDSTTKNMNAADAASLMRGEAGTDVVLTLDRPGVDEPIDIKVTRQVVHINSVPYHVMFADSTGYIKLQGFQHKSSQEVRQALAELLDQGMKRLIFDLRGNGGGYLTEAVQIADLFLPKNRLVVYTAGRAFADTTKYTTQEDPMFGDGPLVILVDGGSASASEIVSGAIQDWDRGLVLGTPTVGKGSVQQTVSIGDRAELKLTMAAYFIPSGRSIDKRMRKDSTLVAMAEKEFHTQVLGRLVRGAGGITPDVDMERRRSTSLYRQLEGWRTYNSRFFRFAREYAVNHPDVQPDFIADQETLDEFRRFVDKDEFEYTSDLDVRLGQLRSEFEEEQEGELDEIVVKAHDDDARAGVLATSLEHVADEIEEIEEDHWLDNDELIAWKLTFDIREKAFGIVQAYAYDVTVNPQVLRAREILRDESEYLTWFQRSEIGDPGQPMASAGDTVAVEVEGIVRVEADEGGPDTEE